MPMTYFCKIKYALDFSKGTVNWFKSSLYKSSFLANLWINFRRPAFVFCDVSRGSILGLLLFFSICQWHISDIFLWNSKTVARRLFFLYMWLTFDYACSASYPNKTKNGLTLVQLFETKPWTQPSVLTILILSNIILKSISQMNIKILTLFKFTFHFQL